jgi:transposase InsO family protein
MSYTASEKLEIIRLVEESSLCVTATLRELGIARATFYDWYARYAEHGLNGLSRKASTVKRFWNRIPDEVRHDVVEIALEHPALTPRELAAKITDEHGYYISESSVYRLLKARDLIPSPNYIVITAADRFQHPTTAVHELWQTDFTYFLINGWGWFYLSTVIDDFSRYVIAWKLCTTMTTEDVIATLDLARASTGREQVRVAQRTRLLSDNGSCYSSADLSDYIKQHGMAQSHGRPYHPQTQGKIERYHRSMKNVILLEHYYLPGELERAIVQWVAHYNNHRYHESLGNIKPVDVYTGKAAAIRKKREQIKLRTLSDRKRRNSQPITTSTSRSSRLYSR